MSCNELDNLQHNGQNVSTLNTATRSTLQRDQLDSFSTNLASMLIAWFLSNTHTRTCTLRFLKITTLHAYSYKFSREIIYNHSIVDLTRHALNHLKVKFQYLIYEISIDWGQTSGSCKLNRFHNIEADLSPTNEQSTLRETKQRIVFFSNLNTR